MPTSDRDPYQTDPLDDSINKLESYINQTEKQGVKENIPVLNESIDKWTSPVSTKVPILDEMVSDEEMEAPESGINEPYQSDGQLLGLIDNLEERLTEVLETLVKSMKDEMIETISEEIKMQLDIYKNKEDHRDRTGRDQDNDPHDWHPDTYRPDGE